MYDEIIRQRAPQGPLYYLLSLEGEGEIFARGNVTIENIVRTAYPCSLSLEGEGTRGESSQEETL